MFSNKKITFEKVCKEFLSKETYDVLSMYKCFEKIQKILDNPLLYPGDFVDLACFFNKTTVVMIIQDSKEIIVNNIKPNQMFLIDFKFKSYSETKEKQNNYATRFNINDLDIITEAYDEGLDDFVIFLYKENDENEYDEIRRLLYQFI